MVTSAPRTKHRSAGSISVDDVHTSLDVASSASSSVDAPTSERQDYDHVAEQSRPGLLTTIETTFEDAYEEVRHTVQDAEEVVEEAWVHSAAGRAWAWYNLKLEQVPIRTKAVTSFIGFVLGDIAAQKIGGESCFHSLSLHAVYEGHL